MIGVPRARRFAADSKSPELLLLLSLLLSLTLRRIFPNQ